MSIKQKTWYGRLPTRQAKTVTSVNCIETTSLTVDTRPNPARRTLNRVRKKILWPEQTVQLSSQPKPTKGGGQWLQGRGGGTSGFARRETNLISVYTRGRKKNGNMISPSGNAETFVKRFTVQQPFAYWFRWGSGRRSERTTKTVFRKIFSENFWNGYGQYKTIAMLTRTP